MPAGTIRVLAAFDAAAAIACAQVTERRVGTLPIFVALVADRALFVAAVRIVGAVGFLVALGQAMPRQGVAGQALRTVSSYQAAHAAVALEIAALRGRGRAVCVGCALDTLFVDATQSSWARLWTTTTDRSCTAAGLIRSSALRHHAAGARYAAARAGCARGGEGSSLVGVAAAASRRRLIEVEARVATESG